MFRDVRHIDLFLDYLNTRHECIQFTKEIEINNSLSFLDVIITKNNNKFTTSVHRKKTFTCLMMNFLSFSPIKYKINLIKTLLHRAFAISSFYYNFHEKVNKIIEILRNNGFKISIILKQIKNFLENKYQNKSQITYSPSKQNIFIKLPFLGNKS